MTDRSLQIVLHLLTVVLAAAAGVADSAEPAERVDYLRQIKPILSNHCYACHGPDRAHQENDLRLDLRSHAIDAAIEPGAGAGSELIARLISDDPDERMPPADSKKAPPTAAQIELLRRWIDQGAVYDEHWAYVVPRRSEPPAAQGTPWARAAIDRFVAAGHARNGLTPAPDADRRTLIRRLSFDLIGLPPTPAEVAAFVGDASPDAYDKVVDRLLASPHYGERMAIYWLDVVRYADTGGYHGDNNRDHAPYRDYVISAFNSNLPYDRFIREQLAGDMLPNATDDQLIASGFNRLNMTTREGGAQPKEYIEIYAADRVRNTSSIFLGLTMGCCQCHDHKFDPYTIRDFYSLAAFFADIKETIVGTQEPLVLLNQRQTQRVYDLEQAIAAANTLLKGKSDRWDRAQAQWEANYRQAASAAAEPKLEDKNLLNALALATSERSEQQRQALRQYFRSAAPVTAAVRKQIADSTAEIAEIKKAARKVLVTMTQKPRIVRVLPRGNWQDGTGEVVNPAVPASLGKLNLATDVRATRLDLANWLVTSDNPLTARVFVNRLWKLMFGRGIVGSLDDFGTQGDLPTHPELLDWLATDFVESGWDVKRMIRQLVMSRSYRQSSNTSQAALAADPHNIWLARQGRFRMDAEMIRDNALAVSGLLVPKIGGTSVRPYQPVGYLAHLNFPPRSYQHDTGENQYRRGLYIYWQRSFLHPAMAIFDAPTREECTVERPQSNTPLQALLLLNDPSYVEAARMFAVRILQEGGDSDIERLNFAYRRALAREIGEDEAKILVALLAKHREHYRDVHDDAVEIQKVGLASTPPGLDPADLAAWISVARTIFNLHETITRN